MLFRVSGAWSAAVAPSCTPSCKRGREWDVDRNSGIEQAATDAQSDPGILGGMGRMGAGRDGFVPLCHGAGSGAARIVAPLRNSGDHRECRLLRRGAIRMLPGGMGLGVGLGTDCRPVWAGPHAEVDNP